MADAARDLARGGGHTALDAGQLDDQRIVDGAFAGERNEIGIGGEAAVPIGRAVDGHGVMDRRQAGRRQHRVHGEFAAAEKARAARGDIGRGHQQLGARRRAQQREIDVGFEELAERIEAQRIEIVGREQRRHVLHGGRAREAREHRIEADEIGQADLGDRFPDRAQLGPRALRSPLGKAGGERRGIHGARARPAQPADLEVVVLEQAVEHAPREGAVRAAALEREIERLLFSGEELQGGTLVLRPDAGNDMRAG